MVVGAREGAAPTVDHNTLIHPGKGGTQTIEEANVHLAVRFFLTGAAAIAIRVHQREMATEGAEKGGSE